MAEILTQEEIDALLEVVEEDEVDLENLNPSSFSDYVEATFFEIVERLTGKEIGLFKTTGSFLGDVVVETEYFNLILNDKILVYITENLLGGGEFERNLSKDDFDVLNEIMKSVKNILKEELNIDLKYSIKDEKVNAEYGAKSFVYEVSPDNFKLGIIVKITPEKNEIQGITEVIKILENGVLDGTLKIKYKKEDIEEILNFLKKI